MARGITGFQRFGYIERNGQSNLAVPLGRVLVSEQPLPMSACLDDVAPWLARLRRQARSKGATGGLIAAERHCADAVFKVLQRSSDAAMWQALLLALADAESVMRRGAGFQAQPVPSLRP